MRTTRQPKRLPPLLCKEGNFYYHPPAKKWLPEDISHFVHEGFVGEFCVFDFGELF